LVPKKKAIFGVRESKSIAKVETETLKNVQKLIARGDA